MASTIVAKNLRKSYKSQVLFNNLSFALSQGNRLAITGPSGIGKTTLLNILGTLDRPDAGSIIADGTDLVSESSGDFLAAYRLRQGFVAQEPLLIPDITAKENVLIPLLSSKRSSIRWSESRLAELARRLGVDSILGRKASLLSTGEKRRVDMLRALMKNPRILIADEPTASLDDSSALIVTDVLKESAADGMCVVFSLHRDSRLASLANSTINLLDYK